MSYPEHVSIPFRLAHESGHRRRELVRIYGLERGVFEWLALRNLEHRRSLARKLKQLRDFARKNSLRLSRREILGDTV